MESRDLTTYESAFRNRGFSVARFPDFLRLVKDHCEVHVAASPGGTSSRVILKIPVVRAELGSSFPERLLTYLAERNAAPKGPGRFEVLGDCIWCACEAPADEAAIAGLPDIASDLVAQVERLGPKILNLK